MATLKGSRTPESDRSGRPTEQAAARGRPYLEVQYHPGDIRRGVRYLFLTRRQVNGWIAAVVAWLAFLLFAATITPTVIANRLNEQKYRDLQEERGRQGDRLKVLVTRLGAMEGEASQALARMSKIHLAYGLPNEGQGQGGYPSPPLEPSEDLHSIYRQEVERGYELLGSVKGQMSALRVFFDEVEDFETANRDQVATTPSLSPLHPDTFVMTSPFGTRRSPFTKEVDFHAGIDLAATIGTPIYAPADGTVTFAGRIPLRQSVAWWRYGNLVAIQHGENLMSLFGHCEDVLLLDERKRLKKKTVQRGEIIATVGNTGWSTNPHLHYEIRWRDEEGEWHPVDPRIYILDHRWSDEERVLIRARKAPSSQDYEPLPRAIGR